MISFLDYVALSHQFPPSLGVTSVCSAHPYVIEATLRNGEAKQIPVLIESTCNQVNQYGGYTGMTPLDFVDYVENIAARIGFPRERILLGGDHLGPLVWANETANNAMTKAKALVKAYIEAGFSKIHLDCSVPCIDDRDLSPKIVAERSAELAVIAETTSRNLGLTPPRYVIGTEVPPAGGYIEENLLAITRPEDVAETLSLTRQAFLRRDLADAWERVIAVVVQPGVEFGAEEVHTYSRETAKSLSRFIESHPALVYEAHSTDYQPPAALRAMVEDHFAILKVGPALTFAFREAIFALAAIEECLCETPSRILNVIEEEMLYNPKHWIKYYRGSERQLRLARQYSYSDRIRYYWMTPAVKQAFHQLRSNLSNITIPLTLISQYLPHQYQKVLEGSLPGQFDALVIDKIRSILEDYNIACGLSKNS